MPDPESGAASTVQVIVYDPQNLEETAPESMPAAREARDRPGVTWVNVHGSTDPVVLESLETDYGLHQLTLEDVKNLGQRPKVEEYDDYLFIVVQMPKREPGEDVWTEQVSIILGKGWVITVQETPGDVFDGVRARLRAGRPRIRGSGGDYLAYALLDAIVDAYFPILEAIGDEAQALEEEALEAPTLELRAQLQSLRRELLALRRLAWPQQDAVGSLEREEFDLITDETRTFLRDVNDHAARIRDLVETNREYVANLMDLYLAGLAQRTNDVMKVLTIVATIFIPLTFVAGIYGMNFDPGASPYNMPELGHPLGYPIAIAVMVVMGLAMAYAFRRQGWL